MKRENAGSSNSGLEKEQTLEIYSAQLQKPRNFTELCFRKYGKYLAKEDHEGGHLLSTRVGGAPPLSGRAPCLVGPLKAPWCPSSPIWGVLTWKKSEGGFRDQTPPSRGGNQYRAPAELFYRGYFPLRGGNRHRRHHQQLSHLGEGYLHQQLHQHYLLSNPSSSVSNLVSKNHKLVPVGC